MFTTLCFSVFDTLFSIGGFGVSYIELLAVLCGLACVYLASVGRVNNFVWGLISFTLFAILFYHKGFVSSFIYHLFLTGFAVYGYWVWKFPKPNQANDKKEQKIRVFSPTQWFLAIGVLVLATGIWGSIVYYFRDTLPLMDVLYDTRYQYYQDAFMLMGTIVAQWMMSRKNIGCWLVYLFVDAVSVFLYWGSGNPMTSVLHFVYIGLAINGYFSWRKMHQSELKKTE